MSGCDGSIAVSGSCDGSIDTLGSCTGDIGTLSCCDEVAVEIPPFLTLFHEHEFVIDDALVRLDADASTGGGPPNNASQVEPAPSPSPTDVTPELPQIFVGDNALSQGGSESSTSQPIDNRRDDNGGDFDITKTFGQAGGSATVIVPE